MHMLKIAGWRGVMIVGILVCLASASAKGESANAPGETHDWESLLYQGLRLCYQGEYRSAFEMVEKAVRSEKPGPEVHRCLALMRHAYVQTRGQHLTVSEWKTSVAEDLGRLEALKEPGDADLVILATLKYAHVCHAGSILTSEPFLDKLIDPVRKSPWRDWAYWEKARVVASKAWVSTRTAWGSVEFLQGDTRQIGCLDDHPDETLPARAAQAFLKENPDSYMGDTMRKELCHWRVMRAYRGIHELIQNEWYSNGSQMGLFPLSEEQVQLFKKTEETFAAISALAPEDVRRLMTAEGALDNLLWFAHPAPKRTIVAYLKAVLEVRGPAALPEDVHRWLSGHPEVEKPGHRVVFPGEEGQE